MIGTNVAHIARRYAKALFEIALESKSLAPLVEEVSALAETYASSPELREALDNPRLTAEAKQAILREVADGSGASPVVKHTLLLLGERRRLHVLPALAARLRELALAKQGIVRADVTTAVRLSDAYYAKLQAQLETLTGQRIALERHEDPAILAGVIARIGDRVYDGSLRTRLHQLKSALVPN